MAEGFAPLGGTAVLDDPRPSFEEAPATAAAPAAAAAPAPDSWRLDKSRKPQPDAGAVRGWTWDRKDRQWVPKKTGDILFFSGDSTGSADSGRDPDPGWMNDSQPAAKKLPYSQVPKKVKDDAASFAGLVGLPLISMLQAADPYCGTVFAQNYEGIVDAALPLILRSEKVIKYFSTDTSDWMLWVKLAMALAPVGKAIADHHIFRTVQLVRDPATGQVQVMRRSEASGEDHLVPPVAPEYEYTA